MKRLRDKAVAAYEPYFRGHHLVSSYPAQNQDDDDDDIDQDLRVLGGKTNVSQLPISKHLKTHQDGVERLTKSPVPIPTTTHLDNVHPLLLQYVEQSQRVSSNPTEHGAYVFALPGSSTVPNVHIQVDDTPSYYTLRPDMHMTKQESLHQDMARYVGYSTYSESPAYRGGDMLWSNHYDASDSHRAHEQQPQLHYTDPSLESHTDLQEYEMNQYSAWQTHMKHLGLPY